MQPIDMRGVTMALGNSGLAAGTTTTLSASATPVCINGKTYTQGAVSNVQPATTDYVTGAAPIALQPGKGCIFVVGTTSAVSTTLVWIQSEIVDLFATPSGTYVPGGFIVAPEFPVLPDGFCPLGYITVKVASTQAAAYTMFTTGTTATGSQNSNTTGFANLYTPCATLPARPPLT